VGTAVTIAFVMVVVMIYDFRTADIAPETDRSRMIYTDIGQTLRKNGTNVNTGMGKVAFDALFTKLPGIEDATWYEGISRIPCSLPASQSTYNCFVRSVASNWFSFFHYNIVSGRPFTQEEYDARRRVCVITEHTARQLFGTVDVVGKYFFADFVSTKVVGVIQDVSSIFQVAYADAFLPFSLEDEDNYQMWTAGLGGFRRGLLKMYPDTKFSSVEAEVQRRQDRLNNSGQEYIFKMQNLYTQTNYSFFRGSSINASLAYGLLIIVLLIVPAISISGLMHAQMQGNLAEMALRKVYGASNLSIMGRLFTESLVTTLLGGVIGYLLSCLLIFIGRTWLLGTGGVDLDGIALSGGLMLRPLLFIIALGTCVVFNLLSVCLPAWIAVHRNIVSILKGE